MTDGIKKPTFFGQGLLLTVPLVVLLVIGFHSLRQDKIQIHREAAERAQQTANSLVVKTISLFTPSPESMNEAVSEFEMDSDGKPIKPQPLLRLTPIPLTVRRLTPAQTGLWQTAQEEERTEHHEQRSVEAYQKFLALNPPQEFAANAIYSVGLLEESTGKQIAAASSFATLIANYPEALSEGGMPFVQLALLKLIALQKTNSALGTRVSLDFACSNFVFRPTPLTRALLNQAARSAITADDHNAVQKWIRVWEEQQEARRIYEQIPAEYKIAATTNSANATTGDTAFWFQDSPVETAKGPAKTWLVIRYKITADRYKFICYAANLVRSTVARAIDEAGPSAKFLSTQVLVANKVVASTTAVESKARIKGENPELLGSARGPRQGDPWCEARIILMDQPLLYEQQRSRTIWFGIVIAVCAIAAVAGLISNWLAFKRQQRLNELKSNFVSSVSHELRTPVASVRLLVEGLSSGRISGAAKQKEYLHLMGQECRRLSGLIDNILDISRIDNGMKTFEFSPTDVGDLAKETIKMLEPYAAARKVTLAFAAEPGSDATTRLANLDGLAIRQALLNLIDNAIKHSPEGQTVTVTVRWITQSGAANVSASQVQISIRDEGAGIPAEDHTRIFDRFYRRGSELNRETQGIGIGLTIVKHIVESHGGQIRVQSAIGAGSTFTIELPMERERVVA